MHMIWMQRLVALAFIAGLAALAVGVFAIVWEAEGIPPMPIFAGLIAALMLTLLAGACLALMSIAVSARRAAVALEQSAAQARRDAPEAPPVGRRLVAERSSG